MTLSLHCTRTARRTTVAVLASAATAAGLLLTAFPSQAADTATTRTGTISGAAWTAKVPANWNHTLLLWNHGIRTTVDPNRAAEWAPKGTDGDTTDALLAKGYAVVGSSYRSNGFAVRDAVNDDIALLAEFTRQFGKPARTYVWGESLGGLITETLAEERPDLLTGSAPACGVLSGAVPIFDQTLDTMLMVRAFFRPTLKVGGYASDAEAANAFALLKGSVTGALADPATQTGAVGRLVAIAVLQGLPLQTRNYNGLSISSMAGAAAEGVLTQAGAALLGYRDSVARTGGIAATNVGTSYLARVTPEAVARFQAVGLPKDLLTSFALTLDRRVGRLVASAAARTKARTLGAPRGRATKPTVTMHTEFDQFVTASNEAVFASRVASAGATAKVLQLFVAPPAYTDAGPTTGTGAPYGAGHCTFSSAQWMALLGTLEAFVSTGQKPDAATVSTVWKDAPGLDRTFRPLPWRGTAF
ncbi:MAG: o-phthalyl amidase [Frankiales bacterium]|nr:o-phthalyl amidase [Frankiales bacterium]